MNPKRDYIVTVISVFLALGIGILVGASLSDNIIVRQQRELVERMEERLILLNDRITGLQEDNDSLNKELVSWMQFQEKILPEYVGSRLEGIKIAVIYESGDQEVIAPVLRFLESAGIQVHGTVQVNAQGIKNAEKIQLEGTTYDLGQPRQRKDFFNNLMNGVSSYLVGRETEQQISLTVDEILSIEITEMSRPDKILYFPGELDKSCRDLHEMVITSFENVEVSFVSVNILSSGEQQYQYEAQGHKVFAVENVETIFGKLELLNMLESELQEVLNH